MQKLSCQRKKGTSYNLVAKPTVIIRPARSGNYPPMIVSIPKKIVDAMKLKKGESLRIYLDRFEAPTI